jgi:5,10-methylenetetrahydrofolate reductase
VLWQLALKCASARCCLTRRYEEKHGPLELPVLVGVLPLASERHASFLHNEVPGVTIPETIRERLRRAGEKSREEGIKISLELLEELCEIPQIRGAYLMPPFGHYETAAEIIEAARQRELTSGR